MQSARLNYDPFSISLNEITFPSSTYATGSSETASLFSVNASGSVRCLSAIAQWKREIHSDQWLVKPVLHCWTIAKQLVRSPQSHIGRCRLSTETGRQQRTVYTSNIDWTRGPPPSCVDCWCHVPVPFGKRSSCSPTLAHGHIYICSCRQDTKDK